MGMWVEGAHSSSQGAEVIAMNLMVIMETMLLDGVKVELLGTNQHLINICDLFVGRIVACERCGCVVPECRPAQIICK